MINKTENEFHLTVFHGGVIIFANKILEINHTNANGYIYMEIKFHDPMKNGELSTKIIQGHGLAFARDKI